MCNSFLSRQLVLSFVLFFATINIQSVQAAKTLKLATGEVLHDPTAPKGWRARSYQAASTSKKHFTLNYIMQSAGSQRAMVNGKKVMVGDYVSGAKVTKIQQNSVTLLLEGKYRILRLNKAKSVRKN